MPGCAVNDGGPLAAVERVSRDLKLRGKRFALVGGLAVTARSEPRFTRDVDLCVVVESDEEAERLVFDMRAEGYDVVATVEHGDVHRLSTVRLRNPDGIVCDLLLASSGVEAEVVARATEIPLTENVTLPVAIVEDLLALKVLSATHLRPQDLLDVRALVDFNPNFKRELVLETLRLVETRGYHRGQNLEQKLEEMLNLVLSTRS